MHAQTKTEHFNGLYYREQGNEIDLFEHAAVNRLPVLINRQVSHGATGSGKPDNPDFDHRS